MKVSRIRFCFVILVLLALAFVPELLAQKIKVESADPPTTEQGTANLIVTIKGRGFAEGAQTQFLQTGTANPAASWLRTQGL